MIVLLKMAKVNFIFRNPLIFVDSTKLINLKFHIYSQEGFKKFSSILILDFFILLKFNIISHSNLWHFFILNNHLYYFKQFRHIAIEIKFINFFL